MEVLSPKTEGSLIEIIRGWSHGEIGTVMRQVNLSRFDPGPGTDKKWINKDRRLQIIFDAARSDGGADARRGLLDLVLVVANRHAANPSRPPSWLPVLVDQLAADGVELRATASQDQDARVTYQLLPTGPVAAPIEPEFVALEADLADRGYSTALGHYEQAVRAYVARDLEASNGQLRSFLEDLLIQVASSRTAYSGTEPVAALQALQDKRLLLDGEFNLLRGLWALSQERGAHRGLTSEAEALFRLQVTTSVARFLLHHVT